MWRLLPNVTPWSFEILWGGGKKEKYLAVVILKCFSSSNLQDGARRAASFAKRLQVLQPLLQLLGTAAKHRHPFHHASCRSRKKHTHTLPWALRDRIRLWECVLFVQVQAKEVVSSACQHTNLWCQMQSVHCPYHPCVSLQWCPSVAVVPRERY